MTSPALAAKTTPHPPDAADTRLHGRWLLLARAAWLFLVTCTLALFVGSLPVYYRK
jgi:hypothetical protein